MHPRRRVVALILPLSALSLAAGPALADDGPAPAPAPRAALEDRLGELADEIASFSPAMGQQAARTIELGRPALDGIAREDRSLHTEKDAAGVRRLWVLGVDADGGIEGARVASVGDGFDHETSMKRTISVRRKGGRIAEVTAVASYDPRGAAGKSFHTVTVEKALPFGFRVTDIETRRRHVDGGKVHLTPVERTRALSRGSVSVSVKKKR